MPLMLSPLRITSALTAATAPALQEDNAVKALRIGGFCLAVAAVVACSVTNNEPGQTLALATPNVVSISASEYAFQSPDTIPAGWTTLRFANHGQEIHYGHLVRLDSGKTVQELVDAYAEAIRTSGPRPKWVTRFGGPGGAAPGDSSSVTQYVEPGSYVWICPIEDSSGNPHFGKGEFKSVVVRTSDASVNDSAAAPEASIAIRLLDYSFEVGDSLRSGHHTIRVENAGVEPHDLVLMKLAPGTTMADVQRWLNPERARRSDQAADPAPSPESLGTFPGGIAAIAPGMRVYFDADITAGEYVFICMATAPDGRSHIEHGMVQRFSVR